jgi:hypothetical protein
MSEGTFELDVAMAGAISDGACTANPEIGGEPAIATRRSLAPKGLRLPEAVTEASLAPPGRNRTVSIGALAELQIKPQVTGINGRLS